MSFKISQNESYSNLSKLSNENKIKKKKTNFDEILQKQLKRDLLKNNANDVNKVDKKEVVISKHAQRRLISRNIDLSENDIESLSVAMDKAKSKGAKESLLIYKDIAFISNVSSKTIITTMGIGDGEENIFTNIDSAVFVKENI